jgi:hypothetical protein
MRTLRILIFIFFTVFCLHTAAQDSTVVKADSIIPSKKDTVIKKKWHDPKKATIRSAILPGWGQIYNREWWKAPIVWGALGTCAGIWIYNNTWYHRTKSAFEIRVDNDTARFGEIHERLFDQTTGLPLTAQSLQFYRNQFRKNRDYSALWFIITWGLNVVDATVFGHLKNFDVSDDLSLNIKPNLNPLNKSAGFSLALSVKSGKTRNFISQP